MQSVTEYRHIRELPAPVRALFDAAGSDHIEFMAEWFENLQNTVFPSDETIRYLTLNEHNMPTALLPIRRSRDGTIREIHALSNYYTSLYQPVLARPAVGLDLRPLLSAAGSNHGKPAHVMNFRPMDPDSQAYRLLYEALRGIGWRPFAYFCFGNWYLQVDRPWREYLQQRQGALRSTISRKRKKFSADGGSLETLTAPPDTQRATEDFKQVYSRSWKKPEPYPAFIPGLVRWLARTGQLRLGIAHLAGRPIAAQIWIVSNKKAYIYKLAYDEAYARYAPGTILTAHLFEHVMDRDKVTEVDYLIGDDPYKQSWMTHRRERWGIVAYNPRTLPGAALFLRAKLADYTKRAINHLRPRK